MARITLRQKAIDDLNNIWLYTYDKWSENQANKYYSLIRFTCKSIGENPNLGKEYGGINENLFGLKSGKHIVFYQLLSIDEIDIIRILHESMDLENRMFE